MILYYYSIKYLKQSEKNSSFYFLQCFKLYRVISKVTEPESSINSTILKWLKLRNNSNFKSSIEENKITYVIKYFNFLVKLLIKYEIFKQVGF
jgi:hypothetical protein